MSSSAQDFAPGDGPQAMLEAEAISDSLLQVNGSNISRSRTPTASSSPPRSGIVVFSGGSAANHLVEIFNQLRIANNTTLAYVVPISDNGGSSSELIRVFGGPGTSIFPHARAYDRQRHANSVHQALVISAHVSCA